MTRIQKTLLRTSLVVAIALAAGQATLATAQTSESDKMSFPIKLDPLKVYKVTVSSKDFVPMAAISRPKEGDGSFTGLIGTPSFSTGTGVPTTNHSTVQIMPDTSNAGVHTLSVSSQNDGPLLNYTITIDVQVTR